MCGSLIDILEALLLIPLLPTTFEEDFFLECVEGYYTTESLLFFGETYC